MQRVRSRGICSSLQKRFGTKGETLEWTVLVTAISPGRRVLGEIGLRTQFQNSKDLEIQCTNTKLCGNLMLFRYNCSQHSKPPPCYLSVAKRLVPLVWASIQFRNNGLWHIIRLSCTSSKNIRMRVFHVNLGRPHPHPQPSMVLHR